MHSRRRIHARHRRKSRHQRVHGGRRQEAGGASAIGIFGGTAAQILARAIAGGAQVFLLAGLSRGLEEAALGKLLFYLAFFLLLESLVDMGISPTALAKAAADPARTDDWIRQAQRARWKCAIPACLVIPLVAIAYGDSPWIPTLIGGAEMLLLPLGLRGIAMQRVLDYRALSLARLGGVGVTLLLSLGGLALGWRSWEFHLASYSAGIIASNLAIWLAPHSLTPPSAAPGSRLLQQALPLGLSNAAQQLYFNAGSFSARQLCSAQRFWEFGLPFRVYSFALLLPQIVTSTAMPVLAARAASDRSAYQRLRRRILIALLTIGIPAASLVALAGPELLSLVFGVGKEQAAPSFRWLALSGVFVCFGAVSTGCLVAQGKHLAMLKIGVATLLLTLPSSWMLTKHYGPEGAAMSCAIAEGFVAAASWIALLRGERRET